MASTGNLFSQTLQEITKTKLDELTLKGENFEKEKEQVISNVQSQQSSLERLRALSDGVKKCFALDVVDGKVSVGTLRNRHVEFEVRNIDRFLDQAQYDPTISSNLMSHWERSMFRDLESQSLKFLYASLYGKLTNEWLSSTQKSASSNNGTDTEMEDFEKVSSGKKMESRLNWERSVFEPTQVDAEAIKKMMKGLFEPASEDSDSMANALKELRESVAHFERQLANDRGFNISTLRWVIGGLLASDLLSDEKRNVLKGFKGNAVIMSEVADVLNMRMAAIGSWSWGHEVPLEERRQLNGTYNIYMHEDVLQAILLQYIGVKWSVFWKKAFSSFRKAKDVWISPDRSVNQLDLKRRDFYLGDIARGPSVESEKCKMYRKDYFLAQLPNSVTQRREADEGDEEADFEEQPNTTQSLQAPQTPRKRTMQTARKGTMRARRCNTNAQTPNYSPVSDDVAEDCAEEGDSEDDDDDSEPKKPMEAKQSLLHLLTTEILIKCRLHGEITCFRSQIDNAYPSLPHLTIETILEFLGVSQKWLKFFKSFLQAPLKFIDDDDSTEPRVRKQGTPGAHALSEAFGEVVLFCLDFKINRETEGEILWRMHDDIWFWSWRNETCAKAWSAVKEFSKTTGLNLNDRRTGSVRIAQKNNPTDLMAVDVGNALPKGQIRWGMLHLNPQSGRFEIDQEMVDQHIEELSRQLKDKVGSVFTWIRVWNSYAATFFTSNFGRPANSFGRQHVNDMLATHNRIQQKIFSVSAEAANLAPGSSSTPGSSTEGSIVDFLKQIIERRFGMRDIPDGYIFFPASLGGLEVRNPFVPLLQIRDTVQSDPSVLLTKFLMAEREAYRSEKKRFESDDQAQKTRRRKDRNFVPDRPDQFFSLEEYTRHRECLNYDFKNQLVDVFSKLLERPKEDPMGTDRGGRMEQALRALLESHPSSEGIKGVTWSMEPYWKWVAEMYGPEICARFGSLGLVEEGWLPMGVVGEGLKGSIKWGD